MCEISVCKWLMSVLVNFLLLENPAQKCHVYIWILQWLETNETVNRVL